MNLRVQDTWRQLLIAVCAGQKIELNLRQVVIISSWGPLQPWTFWSHGTEAVWSVNQMTNKKKIPFWHDSYAPFEACATLLVVLFEVRTVRQWATDKWYRGQRLYKPGSNDVWAQISFETPRRHRSEQKQCFCHHHTVFGYGIWPRVEGLSYKESRAFERDRPWIHWGGPGEECRQQTDGATADGSW